MNRDRQLLTTELVAALDRGLDDDELIHQARTLIRSDLAADDLARVPRVLRQLREYAQS